MSVLGSLWGWVFRKKSPVFEFVFKKGESTFVFLQRRSVWGGLFFGLFLLSGCVSFLIPTLLRPFSTDTALTGGGPLPISGEEINRSKRSYVAILVDEKDRARGGLTKDTLPDQVTSGSGFIVHRDGYVLTAAHIALKIGNLIEAQTDDGRNYSGHVVAILPESDIALIKLDRFDKESAVHPTSSPCLAPQDFVFSIGRHGIDEDIVRLGRLQALRFGRPVHYQAFGYEEAMVLHLRTREGESGAPVFNASGQLIGMVVSMMSSHGEPLNLAHALSVPTLGKFLCTYIACTQEWQEVARQDVAKCPDFKNSFMPLVSSWREEAAPAAPITSQGEKPL